MTIDPEAFLISNGIGKRTASRVTNLLRDSGHLLPSNSYMPIGDAADILGVHRNTIGNWCNEGILRVWTMPGKVGRKAKERKVLVEDVQLLLTERALELRARFDRAEQALEELKT